MAGVPCASDAGVPDWLAHSNVFSEKVTVETVAFLLYEHTPSVYPVRAKTVPFFIYLKLRAFLA
jgi:hypothetical protein